METVNCHFPCRRSIEHLDIAKAIASSGYELTLVIQIDLQSRPGVCVLTLSNFDIRNRLVESGLELKGERVSVLPGDGSLSSCHVLVYGCAPNLHDGHIASALAEFGQLVGIIERESLTHEGVKILTGTRRALVVLQKPVPCKLRISRTLHRTYHRGQQQTCFRCHASDHMARDCPKKATAASSTGARSYAHAVHSVSMSQQQQQHDAECVQVDTQQDQERQQQPSPPPQQELQRQQSPPQESGVSSQQPRPVGTTLPSKIPVPHPARLQAPVTTPVMPAFPKARGKAGHSSPDEAGFVLATGKHTFTPKVLTGTRPPSPDPQVAWAHQASAREMQQVADRVNSRRSSR